MADLEDNNQTIPTIGEYLRGRSQTHTYSIVYGKFIPCIASTKVYKEKIRERILEKDDNTELFTKSDEAFTLLLLENYYDRWMDIYKHNGGITRRKLGSRRKKEVQSEVKPKYTSGGVVYNSRKEAKGKGWKNDCISCYNDLFAIVENDRLNNALFMSRFLEAQRNKEEEFVQRRSMKEKTIVLPRCDLGLNLGIAAMTVTPSDKQIDMGAASQSEGSDVESDGHGSDGDGDNCEI